MGGCWWKNDLKSVICQRKVSFVVTEALVGSLVGFKKLIWITDMSFFHFKPDELTAVLRQQNIDSCQKSNKAINSFDKIFSESVFWVLSNFLSLAIILKIWRSFEHVISCIWQLSKHSFKLRYFCDSSILFIWRCHLIHQPICQSFLSINCQSTVIQLSFNCQSTVNISLQSPVKASLQSTSNSTNLN
jgi:hypothetical protein